MENPPAEEHDEGEHEAATNVPQIHSPRNDALASFDPFSDVFSRPLSPNPDEHASVAQIFDSRPEDAWTNTERDMSLFSFFESNNPGDGLLWWDEYMQPSPTAIEEGQTAYISREVPAPVNQPPFAQLQGGKAQIKEWRIVDNNETSVDDYEKEGPSMEMIEGQPRMPIQNKKELTALPKQTDQKHTATTKEQLGHCSSEEYAFLQVASTGKADDVPRPPLAQTAMAEEFVEEMSCAVSVTDSSPSMQQPFTLAPKKRRWTSGSDPDMRSKRLRRSAAFLPSISKDMRFTIQQQYPVTQSLHQLPPVPSQYSEERNEYFPTQAEDRSLTSNSRYSKEPRPESAYPDPSLYAISSRREPWEDAQTGTQLSPLNNHSSSVRTGLRSRRGQSLDIKSASTRHGLHPIARRQLHARPGNEPNVDRGKFDWPGQDPPDLINLSSWPPPYPAMDQPGPGGPGTWPSDWIELRSRRSQMKYPRFARGTDKIPGRHPLQTYCYWFPNHVRDAGLDHFRAAGWSGRKIWDHYHPNAVEMCRQRAEKGDGKLADRPWNFLQQWLSRRKRQVDDTETGASNPHDIAFQSDASSEDISFRRAKRGPGQPRLNVVPSTSSMRITKRAGGQISLFQTELSLTHNVGQVLSNSNTGLTPPAEEDNQSALGGSRREQSLTAEPWWQKQLMVQVERVRLLLQKIRPRFDQQQYRTQILEANMHLQRQFPMFARQVWLQVLQRVVVPQSDVHPMLALRDIYGQLRRHDPSMQLPDEQVFCDEMMERYLQDISNFLTAEERRLHGTLAANSTISPNADIGTFQHPRGSLHGFHSDNPNNVKSSTLLLQQPVSHHDMGQHQHFSNSLFISRNLINASSELPASSLDVQGHAAQSYPFDHSGSIMRAAVQPVTGSSFSNTRSKRNAPRTGPEEDDAPKPYLSFFEGPRKPG